ncbi:serine--tRNA ligase [Candidatus Vallotia cooleyia]|uniref:serine--tRNA ligase n=1 Tax=Candidatus Vallotiella adelgis TaxID=1177211 RepID=UPI001D028F14|nr:serine--tRNA ligase [Candidatus Vallotia cooleyia]UDG82094.1 Serine--tRNA ligase [Candidatus Vallotia cooleyia]
MLDITLLRKDIDAVAHRLTDRGHALAVSAFRELESERRRLQTHTEDLQSDRNTLSKRIGTMKKRGADTSEIMGKVVGIGDEIKALTICLDEVHRKLSELLLDIPNLPHESVPIGLDETGNVEVRRWGTPRTFNFSVKDHVDLGVPLGIDFEAGAKLAGSRFTLLRGQAARLHRALAQFMLDTHTQKHGYTECYTPYIVNSGSLYGTGQLPKFADDMFRVEKGGGNNKVTQYLIPTSEIPLTNTVRDSIINADQLPIRLTGHSPCFRSEAGAYGRDTRGIMRQHQFDKVELVQITSPDSSYQRLEEMVGHAEAILQQLELPYRVIALCTGDMGFSAAKTYDLEVWLPAQNTYREVSSCSNTEAFQARRMRARFRTAQGKPELVHTLNGSGLAVGRTLVAILENGQNADGSVTIPSALRPYMGQHREEVALDKDINSNSLLIKNPLGGSSIDNL